MNQPTLLKEYKTMGQSCLDYTQFEVLSLEALRLIRSRKVCRPTNGNGQIIQSQVEDIKEAVSAAVNDRLSASQR